MNREAYRLEVVARGPWVAERASPRRAEPGGIEWSDDAAPLVESAERDDALECVPVRRRSE